MGWWRPDSSGSRRHKSRPRGRHSSSPEALSPSPSGCSSDEEIPHLKAIEGKLSTFKEDLQKLYNLNEQRLTKAIENRKKLK